VIIGNKTLSCAQNTTSNFSKYLENIHKNVELEVRQIEGAKRKGKRSQADNEDDNEPMNQQCTLPSMLKNVSSTKLCNALVEYVIKDMQPLSSRVFCIP